MRLRIRPLFTTFGILLSLSGVSAMAATLPDTGLGQSWPNAADVSASPNYHVYVFERLDVRYVQINDASGTVRAAFAYREPDIMGLPIGVDASRLVTPTEGAADVAATSPGEKVYDDGVVKVDAALRLDGTVGFLVVPSECDNPAECSVRGP